MSLTSRDRRMTRARQAPSPGREGPGRRVRTGTVWVATAVVGLAVLIGGCSNSPYPKKDANSNTLYNSLTEEPLSLDPAVVYGGGSQILMDIIETPVQYNYVDRPYKLEPLLASEMPKRHYETIEYDGNTYRCPVYRVHIKKGVMYQNHPCFVKEYRNLTDEQFQSISTIKDFKKTATRELTADDFVYGMRRLGDQRVTVPIYSTLSDHLLGFNDFSQDLNNRLKVAREKRAKAAGPLYNQELDEQFDPVPLDYNKGADKYPFIRKVDRYTYEFVETGKKVDPNNPNAKDLDEGGYPQLLYWMTFNFFAPVPQEAIEFFYQPGMLQRGITFDKNPIGTGPYIVEDYDPTCQVVLKKNPNFRDERYPSLAKPDPNDKDAVTNYNRMKDNGLLEDCGKKLPFIDRIVFRIEREAIPRWNKFMQGYYDTSGVQTEQFDQTVSLSSQGDFNITESMENRGIRLLQTTTASLGYEMFNMDDPVFGGYTEKKRKLRHAISIAIDTGEAIDIFRNGMALEAQGPIPPGVFGHVSGEAGINPYVFDWDPITKRPKRKSIEEAKKLLAEAGYPGGFDANGTPLKIDYLTFRVTPAARSSLMLLRKQLERINVQIKFTQLAYNEFRKKIMNGGYQMAPQGWAADYPDPETFLILFHKAENLSEEAKKEPKYYNPEFEKLYAKMAGMDNGPERMAIIRKMVAIVRKDAPFVFETHGLAIALIHGWLHNYFPYPLTKGTDKYLRIDTKTRFEYRKKNNVPNYWPVAILIIGLVAAATPAVIMTRRHLREK